MAVDFDDSAVTQTGGSDRFGRRTERIEDLFPGGEAIRLDPRSRAVFLALAS
jgi:hypothetical protein